VLIVCYYLRDIACKKNTTIHLNLSKLCGDLCPKYSRSIFSWTRCILSVVSDFLFLFFIDYLPPTKEEVNAFARVYLSVCLSVSKSTKNACMDLDEMLRVDRRRDMDELINR